MWISYVTLGVADLDRAIGFYGALLGQSPVRRGPTFAFFEGGGGQVLAVFDAAAMAEETGAGVRPGGVALSHNVPGRDDVEPLLQTALSAGATLLRPRHQKPWGAEAAWIADPDGHPWELVWNPRRSPSPGD